MSATFWIAGAAIGLCSCLATAIGVGGGGTFLPILIGILGLTPHKASRLTPACVFGGATGAFMLNIRSRDPHNPNRSLIDTNAILTLSPFQAAGTGVGVLLNSIIPPWLILFMALITVLLCLKITLTATIKHWMTKNPLKHDSPAAALFITVEEDNFGSSDNSLENSNVYTNHECDNIVEKKDMANNRYGPSFDPPYMEWVDIIVLWIINGTIGFLRGGGSGGLIDKGTLGWYVVVVLGIIFSTAYGITAALRRSYRAKLFEKEYRERKDLLMPEDILSIIDQNTLHFTKPVLLKIIPSTFMAGAIASALGIGGGMFLGPIMLAGGMDPLNVAATTITLIFFSSSLTVLGFAAGGQFDWSKGLPLFVICLVSSLIGKRFVDGIIKRYQLQSLLLAALSCLLIGSGIGLSSMLYRSLITK